MTKYEVLDELPESWEKPAYPRKRHVEELRGHARYVEPGRWVKSPLRYTNVWDTVRQINNPGSSLWSGYEARLHNDKVWIRYTGKPGKGDERQPID